MISRLFGSIYVLHKFHCLHQKCCFCTVFSNIMSSHNYRISIIVQCRTHTLNLLQGQCYYCTQNHAHRSISTSSRVKWSTVVIISTTSNYHYNALVAMWACLLVHVVTHLISDMYIVVGLIKSTFVNR